MVASIAAVAFRKVVACNTAAVVVAAYRMDVVARQTAGASFPFGNIAWDAVVAYQIDDPRDAGVAVVAFRTFGASVFS